MTNGPIIRGALLALAVFSLPAARAEAFCNLFKGWFGAPATTTYYAPYTASFAPAGCGQTVNYVAQTSYRTVYVNAPVTTLRPMPAVDGCTGCPTTVMRPVVTYVPQARLVPYTSYRPVVTAAAPCCGAATTAAYYAPAAPVYAAAPVAVAPAPCCGGGAPAMAAPAPLGVPGSAVPSLAPTLNYPGPAPLTAAPPQGTTAYPGTTPYAAPLNSNPPSAAPPAGALPQNATGAEPGKLEPTPDPNVPAQDAPQNKTFGKPPTESDKPAPESRLLLPPQAEPAASGTNRALHGLDPEDQDRFTAVPMRQVWAMKPVATALKQPSVPVQVTPTKQIVPTVKANDNNPWRAARP
jgi:hypothetical protein